MALTAPVACSKSFPYQMIPIWHKSPTTSLALSHPLCADLDPGLAEGLDGVVGIDAEDCTRLSGKRLWTNILAFSLHTPFEVVHG